MALLLNQGLPRSAVGLLAEAGLAATHVGDIGLAAATDSAILEYGRANNLVVVSLDSDFHHLLALSGATAPSVVRLRVEGLRGVGVADLLVRVVDQFTEPLERGSVMSVTTTSIRVRYLPIGVKPR
ncbi:MAG: DUF5615 family PIN-like protein [Planctomycetota bacterium]